MTRQRKMQNPEKWIGQKEPTDLEWGHHWWVISICDNCRCFYHPNDLHSLLYPYDEADQALEDALGVEEAQSFCPACLEEIEAKADEIDPGWRKRHLLD